MIMEAQLYFPMTGFTVHNRSLAGRPQPLYPIRLLPLHSIPYAYWGGVLIWAVMEALGIIWGDNLTLKYETLTPGWIYEWDLKTTTFTVTTAEGEATSYPADTLSDLGIAWVIVESSQFYIYPLGRNVNGAFLVGTRIDSVKQGEYKPCDCMNIDYLRGIQHAVFDFLSGHSQIAGDVNLEGMGKGIERIASILFAKTNEINFMNHYPINLYPGTVALASKRLEIKHMGYTKAMSYLMIRLFAARLLSPLHSKIVYEPWMLWEIFKWVFVRPAAGKRDRIFDLSPWWG